MSGKTIRKMYKTSKIKMKNYYKITVGILKT